MNSLRDSGAWTRNRRIAFATLAAAGVAWAVFGTSTPATSAEAKAAPPAQALLLVPADLVTVDTGPVAQGIKVTGTLEPRNRTAVNARINAVVNEVLVREGETVRKGQVLVRQDSADVQAQLRQAEAQLESAKIELRLSEAYQKRKETLNKQQYLSDVELATAQGETEVRRGNVQVREAAVAITRKAVADATVTAPIGGMVAERHVEPGTNVMSGQAMLTLVDLTELELAASIPARDISQVRVGNEVSFTVDGHANRAFRGKVVRINPMANGNARTITLYARVPNADGALRGGMFASGRVVTVTAGQQALRIPGGAVRRIDNREQVWVVRAGKLALQPVTLGARDTGTGLVEVRQGLAAGEQVILTDIGARTPGMPVSVSATR